MPREVCVGLVQIGELNWGHRQRDCYRLVDGVFKPLRGDSYSAGTSFVYLPYSVGSLQAFAQFGPSPAADCRFLEPVYSRIPVDDAVDKLVEADLVAFSVYVWNVRLSLAIAAALKARRPTVTIAFGGPQVPDAPERFLREHPFIDVVAHGEGEVIFSALLDGARLDAAADRRWEDVPGVSFLDAAGTCVTRPRPARERDLSRFPSPYLTGVFDDLMDRHADHQWMAMWETNRGCPFSCTFCDWGSAVSARINRFELDRLEAEADWFAEHGISHVFVCDANFGILPRDVEVARFLVDAYERRNQSLAVSVQNTKTATERSFEIQRMLTTSRAVSFGATLSLQSVDEQTLANVRRGNISLDVFQERQRRFAADGISTYTDIILGMPGETYDSFADGVAKVIAEGQHNRIAFYNCSVLPNAEMGNPEYRQRFGMETVPVRIVHEHDPLDRAAAEEVPEFLDTVVATGTMDRDAWVETRVFADMTSFLHFDRVLQVPFVLLAGVGGTSYRALVELFTRPDPAVHPVCAELAQICRRNARSVQRGEPEYVPSEDLLGLWWPADQYLLVKLVAKGRLDAFYAEAQHILSTYASHTGGTDSELVADAVRLNHALLRLPNQYEDAVVETAHTVLESWRRGTSGRPLALERRRSAYRVERTTAVWMSWRTWAVDITTQTYRPEAFLYPAAPVEVAGLVGAPGGG
jgi:radical SAM superfamily enzyme YgiQ (UPF0313 family)